MRVCPLAALARATVVAVVLPACGEPAVDALVLWVEGQPDQAGNRVIRVYDNGERSYYDFEPEGTAGASPRLLQLAIDERVRGIVSSDQQRTLYFEIGPDGGRRGVLDRSIVDVGEVSYDVLADDFSLTRNHDAVLRGILGGEAQRWGMLPLLGPLSLRPTILAEPRAPDPGKAWTMVSATAAPVIVFAETSGSPLHADGAAVVMTYPGEAWPGVDVGAPVELARTDLVGRALQDSASLGRLPATECPDRICLSPSGRVVYTMAVSPCALWRWRWTQGTGGVAPPPERIELSESACPGGADPFLLAALDDDTLMLDDLDRIYTYRLPPVAGASGVVRSLPKITLGAERLVRRKQGSVYVYLSAAGEMIRIDELGPRIVNTEASPCTAPDGVVVSPSGNWALITCTTVDFESSATAGVVVRVSSLGVEQYPGIGMLPLAIDDGGAALLYSYERDDDFDDRVPRGLFALSGEGELSRVDDLEPAPAVIGTWDERNGRVMARFAATARP
jgi:hypothetical protein